MQFRSAECDLAYLVPVFLQRDGYALYAERDYAKVSRLSVRDVQVDVCFFHTGWNTSNIISRPNSLRYLLRLTSA